MPYIQYIRNKINEGLKKSYEALLRRKAALGQDMVIADANGQPLVVPAAELLAKREAEKQNRIGWKKPR